LTNDTTLGVYCYNSCVSCPYNPSIVPKYNITFQVDMNNQIVNPSGVHIIGSFNSFKPDSTQLTSVGNSIYQVTIPLDSGSTFNYRYLNGDSLTNSESVPTSCGVSDGFGNYNRSIFVSKDSTLNLHCFSSCDTCIAPPQL